MITVFFFNRWKDSVKFAVQRIILLLRVRWKVYLNVLTAVKDLAIVTVKDCSEGLQWRTAVKDCSQYLLGKVEHISLGLYQGYGGYYRDELAQHQVLTCPISLRGEFIHVEYTYYTGGFRLSDTRLSAFPIFGADFRPPEIINWDLNFCTYKCNRYPQIYFHFRSITWRFRSITWPRSLCVLSRFVWQACVKKSKTD